MKRKDSKGSGKHQPVIAMKLTVRDREILAKLRAKNRTLRNSDIFRLALDNLAEKQGLLSAVS